MRLADSETKRAASAYLFLPRQRERTLLADSHAGVSQGSRSRAYIRSTVPIPSNPSPVRSAALVL